MAELDHQKQIEEFGQNDDFWLFGYGSLIWKPPPHFDERIPGYIEGYVRRFWQASEDHRGTPSAPGRVATLISHTHWATLSDPHEATSRVWGAAYHIPAAHVAEVREYLDIREINGYSIQFTPFHPTPTPLTSISSPPTSPAASSTNVTTSQQLAERSILATTSISSRIAKNSGETITCLVYIGLPENPQFLGPQDPEELAKHILKSKGPSGENKEYLYALEKSLLELSEGSGDEHVGDLVRRCREIEGAEEWGENGDGDDGDEEDEEEWHVGERLHRVGSTEEQEEIEKK